MSRLAFWFGCCISVAGVLGGLLQEVDWDIVQPLFVWGLCQHLIWVVSVCDRWKATLWWQLLLVKAKATAGLFEPKIYVFLRVLPFLLRGHWLQDRCVLTGAVVIELVHRIDQGRCYLLTTLVCFANLPTCGYGTPGEELDFRHYLNKTKLKIISLK